MKNVIDFYKTLQNFKFSEKGFLINIGQGTGFYFKTLAMLLEKEEDFDYKKFIEKFGRRKQGKELSKTSRTIITSNTQYPVFGWLVAKIEK